jgi:inhibitor of KinA sporulation pathway (predicted exonuclease)
MSRNLSKVLIIDVEATCFESEAERPEGQVNEIIELGCVLFDVKSNQILKSMSIFVKPIKSTVSLFCTRLTTITQDLLDQEGVLFPEAMEILKREFKPRDITWISYGDYDRNQIKKDCDLHNIKSPLSQTHINIKNVFALKNKMPKEVGLSSALSLIGEKFEGTEHRGKDDAINISKVVRKTLWE